MLKTKKNKIIIEEILTKAIFKSLNNIENGKISLEEFKKICVIFAKSSPKEFSIIIKKKVPFLLDFYKSEILNKLLPLV